MPSPETPAAVLRAVESRLRWRVQEPHHRPEQRDQFAALADLFGATASDMAAYGARESIRSVVDADGFAHPEWTAALAAARAWLVPTPVDPR